MRPATIMRDQETIAARVKAAPDAAALKGIIAALGILPGSRGRIYTAQELIERIDAAVQVPSLVNQVTRTLGLRDKVREIACRDVVPQR
jgi:hypothetical protein